MVTVFGVLVGGELQVVRHTFDCALDEYAQRNGRRSIRAYLVPQDDVHLVIKGRTPMTQKWDEFASVKLDVRPYTKTVVLN